MHRLKKHPTGNVYRLTKDEIWVRDFSLPVSPLDINDLTSSSDYSHYLENELANERLDISSFDTGSLRTEKAIIVSDGFNFLNKQKLLEKLPNDISIIATNRSLVKWKINRKIDFFLVNNPYSECINQIPAHRYFPRCLASIRTYPKFLETYKDRGGSIFHYMPSPTEKYTPSIESYCKLDDYRNPICAAINLAYKLDVNKLLMFCCDDSFSSERPAAVKLSNETYTYPQHLIYQRIIEAMLGWYKKSKKVDIGDHSSGLVYEDAPYISEEDIAKFFN